MNSLLILVFISLFLLTDNSFGNPLIFNQERSEESKFPSERTEGAQKRVTKEDLENFKDSVKIDQLPNARTLDGAFANSWLESSLSSKVDAAVGNANVTVERDGHRIAPSKLSPRFVGDNKFILVLGKSDRGVYELKTKEGLPTLNIFANPTERNNGNLYVDVSNSEKPIVGVIFGRKGALQHLKKIFVPNELKVKALAKVENSKADYVFIDSGKPFSEASVVLITSKSDSLPNTQSVNRAFVINTPYLLGSQINGAASKVGVRVTRGGKPVSPSALQVHNVGNNRFVIDTEESDLANYRVVTNNGNISFSNFSEPNKEGKGRLYVDVSQPKKPIVGIIFQRKEAVNHLRKVFVPGMEQVKAQAVTKVRNSKDRHVFLEIGKPFSVDSVKIIPDQPRIP